jgi:hypothetical protein
MSARGGLAPLGDAGWGLFGLFLLMAGLWLDYDEARWRIAQTRDIGRITEVIHSPGTPGASAYVGGRFLQTPGTMSTVITYVDLPNGTACHGIGSWGPVGARVHLLWSRGTPDCERDSVSDILFHWGVALGLTLFGGGAVARSFRRMRERDRDDRPR